MAASVTRPIVALSRTAAVAPIAISLVFAGLIWFDPLWDVSQHPTDLVDRLLVIVRPGLLAVSPLLLLWAALLLIALVRGKGVYARDGHLIYLTPLHFSVAVSAIEGVGVSQAYQIPPRPWGRVVFRLADGRVKSISTQLLSGSPGSIQASIAAFLDSPSDG